MRIFSQNKNFRILDEIREKSKYKRLVRFIIGCFLVAIAYNLFLAPNDIVAGGVGGIAIILNELFKLSYPFQSVRRKRQPGGTGSEGN